MRRATPQEKLLHLLEKHSMEMFKTGCRPDFILGPRIVVTVATVAPDCKVSYVQRPGESK